MRHVRSPPRTSSYWMIRSCWPRRGRTHRVSAEAPASPGAARCARAPTRCRQLPDPRLRERADDLLDLESQVLHGAEGRRRRCRARGGSCRHCASRASCCHRNSWRSTARAWPGSAWQRAVRPRTCRFSPRRWGSRPWSPSGPRCSRWRMARQLVLDARARRARDRSRRRSALRARAPRSAALAARRARCAGGGAARVPHRRRHAHRGVRQYRLARGGAGRGEQRRRRLRAAAHRVPVPRPPDTAPTEDEQTAAYQSDRRCARRRGRSPSARSMWAATSRSPTCRCRPRRIRRSGCAACARASPGRSCCARNCARCSRVRRPAQCRLLLPMVTDVERDPRGARHAR